VFVNDSSRWCFGSCRSADSTQDVGNGARLGLRRCFALTVDLSKALCRAAAPVDTPSDTGASRPASPGRTDRCGLRMVRPGDGRGSFQALKERRG
jgi:hypothetical protein